MGFLIKLTFTISLSLVIISLGKCGEIITSPPHTNWGVWGSFDKCPNGTYAKGFQLKTEPSKGPLIDDTASNGVRLFCGDPMDEDTPSVTSSEGEFGGWGAIYSCGVDGHIYGFELRVEHNGIDDETATNNLAFYCSNNPLPLQGDGLGFGLWRESRKCAITEALCGIQTQVEPSKGPILDDTSLNNIAAECCDIPSPTTQPPSTTTTMPTTTTPTTTMPTTTTPTTTTPTTTMRTTAVPTTTPTTTRQTTPEGL